MHNLNPDWDEQMVFDLELADVMNSPLILEVIDNDTHHKEMHPLGTVQATWFFMCTSNFALE